MIDIHIDIDNYLLCSMKTWFELKLSLLRLGIRTFDLFVLTKEVMETIGGVALLQELCYWGLENFESL